MSNILIRARVGPKNWLGSGRLEKLVLLVAISEGAFLRIFDHANKMTMAELRGPKKRPTSLGGSSFGLPGNFGGARGGQ